MGSHGGDEGDEGGEGQTRNEQRRNRRCAVGKDWPQEDGVLRNSHSPGGTWSGRGEEEREVYTSWVVLHQDPPEACHQGWQEGDVRTDRDGEGHEGKDSGESQACISPEKCGLRHSWG